MRNTTRPPSTPRPTNATNTTGPFEPDLGDLGGEGAAMVLGIVAGAMVLLFCCCFCCCTMRHRASAEQRSYDVNDIELDAVADPGTDMWTPDGQQMRR